MSVVAFGKEIARADVQEEAGEDGEDDTEPCFGNVKKECGEDAGDGGECVDDEPVACLL